MDVKRPKHVVPIQMCHYCVTGDDSPGNSTAVEGKMKSTGDTPEGCRFSQVVSSAITFRLFIKVAIKIEKP